MKSKNGKAIAVILSFVAIAGVVGYLIYRNYKNKPKGTDSDTTPEFTPAPTGGGSTGGGSTSSGNPFATQNDLLKFQRWVIVTKGDKTILGKGGSTGFGDDGRWGSKSASAWAKYQKDYNAGSTSTPPKPVIAQGQAWTNSLYTGLYVNVNDNSPYRNAGLSEYIGTTDGKTYTDYYGRKYYKMKAKWDDGIDTLYVKQQFVTFKKP
jgi:hypothetical protein